jgi:hypothetical protein
VASICSYLESGGMATIEDNAAGCSSISEILDACAVVSLEETESGIRSLEVYPNPFSATAYFRIKLKDISKVSLTIRDMSGRTVATIVHDYLPEGDFILPWDASLLRSGMYFYQVVIDNSTRSGKLILSR